MIRSRTGQFKEVCLVGSLFLFILLFVKRVVVLLRSCPYIANAPPVYPNLNEYGSTNFRQSWMTGRTETALVNFDCKTHAYIWVQGAMVAQTRLSRNWSVRDRVFSGEQPCVRGLCKPRVSSTSPKRTPWYPFMPDGHSRSLKKVLSTREPCAATTRRLSSGHF
jgi:hypothetical protein